MEARLLRRDPYIPDVEMVPVTQDKPASFPSLQPRTDLGQACVVTTVRAEGPRRLHTHETASTLEPTEHMERLLRHDRCMAYWKMARVVSLCNTYVRDQGE